MAKKGQPGNGYYKLGDNTTIFWDPVSQLKIVNGQVVKYEGKITQRMEVGLKNSHIEKATEEEFKAQGKDAPKPAAPAPAASDNEITDFSDKDEFPNKGSLMTYFEENFDPSEEELDEFENLSRGNMEEELNRREAENNA